MSTTGILKFNRQQCSRKARILLHKHLPVAFLLLNNYKFLRAWKINQTLQCQKGLDSIIWQGKESRVYDCIKNERRIKQTHAELWKYYSWWSREAIETERLINARESDGFWFSACNQENGFYLYWRSRVVRVKKRDKTWRSRAVSARSVGGCRRRESTDGHAATPGPDNTHR